MRTCLMTLVAVVAAMCWGCEKQDSTTPAAQSAPDAAVQSAKDAATGAMDAAKEKAGDLAAEGQKLLDQTMQYIKDKKFDLADQAIAKLDSMKAQLPQAVQDGLAKAKTALAEAKKAAGL